MKLVISDGAGHGEQLIFRVEQRKLAAVARCEFEDAEFWSVRHQSPSTFRYGAIRS